MRVLDVQSPHPSEQEQNPESKVWTLDLLRISMATVLAWTWDTGLGSHVRYIWKLRRGNVAICEGSILLTGRVQVRYGLDHWLKIKVERHPRVLERAIQYILWGNTLQLKPHFSLSAPERSTQAYSQKSEPGRLF